MSIEQILCYSFPLDRLEPVAYIRLAAPFQAANLKIINGFQKRKFTHWPADCGDAVLFQREFPMLFSQCREIVQVARELHKPVIFDLDDLLFFLPPNHSDRGAGYFTPSLLPMLQMLMEADLVTVSSNQLCRVLSGFNPNVQVLANYFDDGLWELRPPGIKDATLEPLTIGYMGSNSHKPDLEFISPVLIELLQLYPEKIRLHFWGITPPTELMAFPQVSCTQEYQNSYQDFAAFFQKQTADIFIAPLLDNLFNRCKSPIKYFEYSALGAPGVYSRLEPYSEVISHGVNGFLAGSLAEWKANLVDLIENASTRLQLAQGAQANIRAKYLLSQNAYRWQEAIQSCERASTPRNDEAISFFDSINLQLQELLDVSEAKTDTVAEHFAQTQQVIQHERDRANRLQQGLAEEQFKSHQLEQNLSAERGALIRLQSDFEQSRFESAVRLAEISKLAAEAGQKVSALQTENGALKVEVLSYVLSQSWQLTRPFRKIKRKISRILG